MPFRLICTVLMLLATAGAQAETFGWRGDGSGRFPTATPPAEWAPGRNVVWRVPLERSNASPVLTGNTLFVCEEPATLVALNARTGKVLWKRPTLFADAFTGDEAAKARQMQTDGDKAAAELPTLQAELSRLKREARWSDHKDVPGKITATETRIAEVNKLLAESARYRTPETGNLIGYSSATPATDGKNVYAVFANGVAVAFSLDGRRLWTRWLGETPHPMNGFDRGHSASPLLLKDRLIVGLGTLRALDLKDGHDLWQSDPYRDYGTPALARIADVDVVLTPAGDVVRTQDGRKVASGLAALRYTGPVVEKDVVYFAGSWNPPPPKGDSIEARARAVKLSPDLLQGGAPQVLFDVKLPDIRYYASPLLRDGLLYVVSQKGHLSVLDGSSGATLTDKVIWTNVPDTDQYLDFFPSIASAGPYVFITGEVEPYAATWVLKPGATPELVVRNTFDGFMASPVFAGRRLYVRALHGLAAIEQPGSKKENQRLFNGE